VWFTSDHRGVRIFIRGEFVAPRQWLIHATVAGGCGIDTAPEGTFRQRTLSELWRGIVLESRVGRHRGAVAVRVVVEGDPDIARVFAASGSPDESPAPVRLRGTRTEGPKPHSSQSAAPPAS
jgi:hypothetical protein